MHFIIGILIAAASLVYWLGMASRGAREISNLAHDVKNMPRRRKFQKSASKEAIDLIDDPIDAAIVLMICVARSDGNARVSDIEKKKITQLLMQNMELTEDYADDSLIQLMAMTSQIILQDTLLFAMIDVLRGKINNDEASGLVDMMSEVAQCDGDISQDQSELIRRFKERMGIGY